MGEMKATERIRRAASELLIKAEAATCDERQYWMHGETLGIVSGKKSKVVLDHPPCCQPTTLIETFSSKYPDVNNYLTLVGPVTGAAFGTLLNIIAEWIEAGFAIPVDVILWANNAADAVLHSNSDLSDTHGVPVSDELKRLSDEATS